jgi:hypothetical protein
MAVSGLAGLSSAALTVRVVADMSARRRVRGWFFITGEKSYVSGYSRGS